MQTLEALKIQPVIRDERFGGVSQNVAFAAPCGPISKWQPRHCCGMIPAFWRRPRLLAKPWWRPGSLPQRGVNTLILVHRHKLLEQWIERLSTFLNLPAKAIGRLGGGRKRLTGALDVALMQSLIHKGVVDDRVGDYGYLSWMSATIFRRAVLKRSPAGRKQSLSPVCPRRVGRKDGHHPIIFMQCGPVRHRVDAKTQAAARPFTHHVWCVRPVFAAMAEINQDPRAEFHQLYEALRNDEKRNQNDLRRRRGRGRRGAITSGAHRANRTPEVFGSTAVSGYSKFDPFAWRSSKKELTDARARLAELPATAARVILATGKYLGEGLMTLDWTHCSWLSPFHGGEPLPSMWGDFTASTRASVKCASMTTRSECFHAVQDVRQTPPRI